jgi:hypothetical protein
MRYKGHSPDLVREGQTSAFNQAWRLILLGRLIFIRGQSCENALMKHGQGQVLGILQLCRAPNVARTTFQDDKGKRISPRSGASGSGKRRSAALGADTSVAVVYSIPKML